MSATRTLADRFSDVRAKTNDDDATALGESTQFNAVSDRGEKLRIVNVIRHATEPSLELFFGAHAGTKSEALYLGNRRFRRSPHDDGTLTELLPYTLAEIEAAAIPRPDDNG